MCLGRPMAVNDRDCTCEMPGVDGEDDTLAAGISVPMAKSITRLQASSPMSSTRAGFIVICKLCRLLGDVSNLVNSVQIRQQAPSPKVLCRIQSRIQYIGRGSRPPWLQEAPDSTVHYSIPDAQRGIDLTLCVVASMLHSGALMSLHW